MPSAEPASNAGMLRQDRRGRFADRSCWITSSASAKICIAAMNGCTSAALLRLRHAMNVAPDGRDRARHRGQAADQSAAKTDQRIPALVHLLEIGQPWPEQHVPGIDNNLSTPKPFPERCLCQRVLQEPDRDRDAEQARRTSRTRLCRHSMLLRSAQRFAACTPTLQAIINGMASIGSSTCKRMPPATAEKAKPASPDTKAPENTATLNSKNVPTSAIW